MTDNGRLRRSRWLATVLALVLALVLGAPAMADERPVAFAPVPPAKFRLIKTLLCRDATRCDELKSGHVILSKDVLIAEALLKVGLPKHLFIFVNADGWCGADGCLTSIWEKREDDWHLVEEISSWGEGRLWVQDAVDHGYRRLVERRSMIVDDDHGGRKEVSLAPTVYRWTGTGYRTGKDD